MAPRRAESSGDDLREDEGADVSKPRGLLAITPPYSTTGPPAGAAYLLGALRANGVDDFGFTDLRLTAFEWPGLTYSGVGTFGENFVIDVPDLPLILHLLRNLPETDIWDDFEQQPWARHYCFSRSLTPSVLGTSLRATQSVLRDWAAEVAGVALVGFTTWVSNSLTTFMAAAELKRLGQPPFVVLGGPQCSDSEVASALALKSGLADAVVVGEGEETFLELQARVDPVTRTLSGAPPAGVRVWRDETMAFGGRRKLARLEDLPTPDFGDMNLDAYSRGPRQISFELSRGCTDRCEFCSEWVFWERFRSATPESVVDRLRGLQRRTEFSHVTFSDSLLNGDYPRLLAFADQVIASDLRFSWSGFCRAEIDRPTAKLLARSGFRHVFIGIESLSDRTLFEMTKRRTAQDNLHAIEAFLDAGISVAAGVVAGFPGDTRDDFLNTVAVLQRYADSHPGKFKISLEPFLLTPTAPIFRKRDHYKLTLLPWPDEILEMAPAYAPIAQRCMARVEGPDQTVERSGRFRYAQLMMASPAAN
jgi:hypothetical protein